MGPVLREWVRILGGLAVRMLYLRVLKVNTRGVLRMIRRRSEAFMKCPVVCRRWICALVWRVFRLLVMMVRLFKEARY